MKFKLPKNTLRWVGVAVGAFIVGFILSQFLLTTSGQGVAVSDGGSWGSSGGGAATEFKKQKANYTAILIILGTAVVAVAGALIYERRKRSK